MDMKIQNYPSKYLYSKNFYTPNFEAAKDISLNYVFKNRMHILPKRMQDTIKTSLNKLKNENITLRDLHLQIYNELNNCKTLDEARNKYIEFREVLSAESIVKHKSPNIKIIEKTIPLEKLSLHILKERWGKLKTLDEIAQDLGLKNRSAIAWFMDKIHMPDFEKNYMMLLRASDEKLNQEIAQKTKNYNNLHPNRMLTHNQKVAKESIEIQRTISLEAWQLVPHIRVALSEMARTDGGPNLMSKFWAKYPEFAKEYGQAKSIVAQELKTLRDKKKFNKQ